MLILSDYNMNIYPTFSNHLAILYLGGGSIGKPVS